MHSLRVFMTLLTFIKVSMKIKKKKRYLNNFKTIKGYLIKNPVRHPRLPLMDCESLTLSPAYLMDCESLRNEISSKRYEWLWACRPNQLCPFVDKPTLKTPGPMLFSPQSLLAQQI